MNRGSGGNRRGGGGGGRHYVSRGRSPQHYVPRGRSPQQQYVPLRPGPVLDDASSGSGSSSVGREKSEIASIDGMTKKFDGLSSSDYPHVSASEPCGVGNLPPNGGNSKLPGNVPEADPNAPSVAPCCDNVFPLLSTPSEWNAKTSEIIQAQNQDAENHSPSYFSCTLPVEKVQGQIFHSPRSGTPTWKPGFPLVQSGKTSSQVINGKHELENSASSGSGSSKVGRENSEVASIDGVTKKLDSLLSSDYPHGPGSGTCRVGNLQPNDGNSKLVRNVPDADPNALDVTSVGPSYDNDFPLLSTPSEQNANSTKIIQAQSQDAQNRSPSYFSCIPSVNVTHKKEEPSQTMGGQFSQEVKSGKTSSQGISGKNELENSDSGQNGFSFDICEERNKNVVKLKTPLHLKNKAIRNEMKRRTQGDNIRDFRPGMILLKGYISVAEQVKLIKSCRDLGRGLGGFYQPGYRDGAKLHLKMMCLGKNWDPETGTYGDIRPEDQAKPPPIPNEFQQLVKEAIQECHSYLESKYKVRNARNILPSMSPTICIVNYYTKTGKLGLHQDKDESPESLRKRLPVVSISLGDTAEFLYGDERDIDKADKVMLESGDVLIFGGESRHIFHGVSTIKPDTAPKALLDQTDLRPGRLNLTFREY